MNEPMIRTAVILAAGWGSRVQGLASGDGPVSKPLISLQGTPMVVRVLRTLHAAGIARFHLVTGFMHERVDAEIRRAADALGVRAETHVNPEWDTLANGVSLLCAAPFVDEPFLLSMSDHVFDEALPARFLARGLEDAAARLAVDRKIDRVFDLDDATKVRLDGERIEAIGKDLRDFNAVDVGLFLCRPDVFAALRAVRAERGDVSISDGMRRLGGEGRFAAFDIGGLLWQDVDTPETLAEAERRLNAGEIRFR